MLVTDKGVLLGIITERDVVRVWRRIGSLQAFSCADLMQSPVVAVSPETTCLDAYHLMASRGIRHLAVVDADGHPLGLASEGDVMRNFGIEYYMKFKDVQSVMRKDVSALAATAMLSEALALMDDRAESCVVVADAEGRPVGILTERDIVDLCRTDAGTASVAVRDVMRTPVVTVKPRYRLHTAVKAMENRQIRRLVVVDDTGCVVGLLTHHEIARGLEGDYARYLQAIVELQSRHLEESRLAVDERLLLANILRSVPGTAVLASGLDFRISYVTPSVRQVLGDEVQAVTGADIRHVLAWAGWTDAEAELRHEAVAAGPRLVRVPSGQGHTEFRVSLLVNAENATEGFLIMAQRA